MQLIFMENDLLNPPAKVNKSNNEKSGYYCGIKYRLLNYEKINIL